MKKEDVIRLAPVVFFVSVVFLLVGVYEYSMPLSGYSFLSETDDTVLYDCFSHIKMMAVFISTCASAVLMSYYLITSKRRIRKSYLYIPAGVYALIIVLSYAFSEYKQFALFGSYDRFEGTLVHLCYLFMMFYAINCIDGEKEFKFIVDSLFVAVTLACIIGLTQLLGHDFFSGSLGRMILMGANGGDLEFDFGTGGVYQTVYNRNYVPFYMCLVLPVLIGRIFDMFSPPLAGEKMKTSRKLYIGWLILLFVLMVLNITGARSVGSVPALLAGASCIVLIRLFKTKAGKIIIAIATGCVLFVLILSGMLVSGYSFFGEDENDRPEISYIRTGGDKIEFMVDGNLLVTRFDAGEGGFFLQNEDGEDLDTFILSEDIYRYEFESPDFNGKISFTPMESDGMIFAVLSTKDKQWLFEYTDDGFKYINSVGNREDLDATEHAGVVKNYAFGSGRGYIWDTTLPLILKHPVIGSGADTFMFVFPQDDYATRYSHGLSTDCVYDKPHNMFLQIAVSFGLMGLVAFIAMIICAFVMGLKGKLPDKISPLCLSVYIGLASFLIAALVNDSSVSVMPMFCGLLGCVCAMAYTEICCY